MVKLDILNNHYKVGQDSGTSCTTGSRKVEIQGGFNIRLLRKIYSQSSECKEVNEDKELLIRWSSPSIL